MEPTSHCMIMIQQQEPTSQSRKGRERCEAVACRCLFASLQACAHAARSAALTRPKGVFQWPTPFIFYSDCRLSSTEFPYYVDSLCRRMIRCIWAWDTFSSIFFIRRWERFGKADAHILILARELKCRLVWLSFHLYSLLNYISMINRQLDNKVIKLRIMIMIHESILGHVDDAKVPTTFN